MTTLQDTFSLYGSMESEHASRGLRFDRSGYGSVPVQAFGQIDGDHFYFRFRGDFASLQVGPFDEALENACWERGEQVRKERLANADRDSIFWMLDERPEQKPLPGRAFLPHRITRYAGLNLVTGDPYCGWLNQDEFRELFNRLLDMLEPVPEDQQVEQMTIDWLTQGGLWPLKA